MDCVDGMKMLEDGCVDLVLTSPPYDNLRDYDKIGETWNFGKFKVAAEEMNRVLKDGGVIVWVVGDSVSDGSESGTSFKQALYFMELGLKLHDTMIYIKNGGINRGSLLAYQQKFEYMFVFVKGKIKTCNLIKDRKNKFIEERVKNVRQKDGTFKEQHFKAEEYGVRYNYWIYDTGKHGMNNVKFHPAVFPFELAQDHIISWSNEGDVVLDPFMGSGTTAVACIHNNRNYIGFEMNNEYWNESLKRIKTETLNKTGSLF